MDSNSSKVCNIIAVSRIVYGVQSSFTIYEAGRVCLGAIQVKPASKGHPDIWVLGSR